MEFVIQDISLHYAFGGSNLDLNIDITNALRGVWSEKLLKNAPKKMCFLRRFFIKVLVEINYFLIAIICYFFRCGFYEIFKSSLGVFRFFI